MMATLILSQLTLQQQIATTALAKLAARNAVRRRLKREGRVKVQLVSLSQISRLADIYLEEHPELFAEAAQSDIVQNLAIKHRRRRPDPQRELLCKSQVQIGGQER